MSEGIHRCPSNIAAMPTGAILMEDRVELMRDAMRDLMDWLVFAAEHIEHVAPEEIDRTRKIVRRLSAAIQAETGGAV